MAPYKTNKISGDNPQPSNVANGTAWLSRPDRLFSQKQPRSPAESSGSKSEIANNRSARSEKLSNNENEHKKDEHDGRKKLALIEKLVKKLQNENSTFGDVIQKILDVADSKDANNKSMKYDLINAVLMNLSESDIEEISFMKTTIEEILIPNHIKQLYVENSSIHHMIPLGEGSSGIVSLGSLTRNGKIRIVALKRAKSGRFDKMIIHEARMMSQFQHENVVQILAINRQVPEIAIEFMEHGSFSDAVEVIHFSNENVIQILKDVAAGMEYIHSKDFLHRDLATRNIFINAKKQCKIGDFGTCVHVGNSGVFDEKVYNFMGHNISPETLRTRKFTRKTDVWAMGILILDVYFLANAECKVMRIYMLEALQSGVNDAKRPSFCPEGMYCYCKDHLLNQTARERPSFTVIKEKMEEFSN